MLIVINYLFLKKKNLIIVRAGNIIGGGDFEFSRIIPELFLSLNKNQKLLLRNPNAIRPWQHIFDVLNGLLLIILNNYKNIKNKTIVYNIGPNPNSNVSVLKLVKYIKKKINKLVFYQNKNIIFSETKILKLSNKLIKKETKWKPLLTISKTINLTIEWYETFYKKQESIYQFSINQLKKFFKLY